MERVFGNSGWDWGSRGACFRVHMQLTFALQSISLWLVWESFYRCMFVYLPRPHSSHTRPPYHSISNQKLLKKTFAPTNGGWPRRVQVGVGVSVRMFVSGAQTQAACICVPQPSGKLCTHADFSSIIFNDNAFLEFLSTRCRERERRNGRESHENYYCQLVYLVSKLLWSPGCDTKCGSM